MNPLNNVSTMNKIMEYMAMARPIVSFELIEARVSAGDAAVYAPANDESEFAKQISYLLDHPEERERMGEIGKARVSGALSWEHSKAALLAAYAAAEAKPGRGRQRRAASDTRDDASDPQRTAPRPRSRVNDRSSNWTAK
jgi:spore maturation protein CgeB